MSQTRLMVEAVVFDDDRRVLLVRPARQDGRWKLPGGRVRRFRESVGLAVVPQKLLGLFYVRHKDRHHVVFTCHAADGPPPKSDRLAVAECAFFPVDQLPRPLRRFAAERIRQAAAGKVQALPVTLRQSEWQA